MTRWYSGGKLGGRSFLIEHFDSVRDTLEVCTKGGGYVLGTGNSVANYIPLDNYLAMLDEGRKFTA